MTVRPIESWMEFWVNRQRSAMRRLPQQSGWRLDQVPPNGLVYAPWFRAEQDVAEFLSRGGHVAGTPFQPAAR
jgi:hypothetical protein